MKIIQKFGKENLATVYIGETARGRIEFVESLQPPLTREEKWVLIISTLYGCPVECEMCDAGGSYSGKLSAEEIFAQIDHIVAQYHPDLAVPSKKFKIQFARVGEPSFNKAVLDVLEILPKRYRAPGLMPSLSTIAPSGTEDFFKRLLEIKKRLYPESFQLQFSVHSTEDDERDRIMPTPKWPLSKIAEYGAGFFKPGGRKITLNFILSDKSTIDTDKMIRTFSPDIFFIKMTPLNPTLRAFESDLSCGLKAKPCGSYVEPEIAGRLRAEGYEVLISVGEMEENKIGSNCGQYIKAVENSSGHKSFLTDSYSYSRG